jgi:pyridoxamine 5'-phosphate oxidase family protein
MIFTDAESSYLAGHRLGRLATIGPGGAPQVHPVAVWLDDAAGTIDIGGPALAGSRKFRNVQADPRVSLVVDDQAGTPNVLGQTGRGIEIRGRAEIVTLDPPLVAGFSGDTIRIRPRRIIAWNLGGLGPASPGLPPHMLGYQFRDVAG